MCELFAITLEARLIKYSLKFGLQRQGWGLEGIDNLAGGAE